MGKVFSNVSKNHAEKQDPDALSTTLEMSMQSVNIMGDRVKLVAVFFTFDTGTLFKTLKI
jgi:hypothetical protein